MNVQLKYRLYRRSNGGFYWQDNDSPKQGSLRTKDKHEAQCLINAMNEAHRQPSVNLALGRVYLAAHDPKMTTRTWQAIMDEMATHGIPTTQERCARALRSKAYDAIRNKPLAETTGEDLLTIMHRNGNCVSHYLRRLHNLAINLGWLAWPILAKRAWPKIRSQGKRGITPEEHTKIIAAERNPERRAYYELLYETGASQTDAANLSAWNIDRQNGIIVYQRKKLGPHSEPARLTIGRKLQELLETLPKVGDLFPTIKGISANHRAAEFRRRCRILGIQGVSLHSYRHSWAQRAKACGYPQRFAQEALGHSSRAVHEAYAKGATVICPALDEYETLNAQKLVPLSLRAQWAEKESKIA
ncbi:MAG TPA: tyrosine-type recombinase/integrase [Chthoniobacteraceae bacterium]|nr:tyrosine-type recombinase/integrase [Chthoniobacteraceae bacterium]